MKKIFLYIILAVLLVLVGNQLPNQFKMSKGVNTAEAQCVAPPTLRLSARYQPSNSTNPSQALNNPKEWGRDDREYSTNIGKHVACFLTTAEVKVQEGYWYGCAVYPDPTGSGDWILTTVSDQQGNDGIGCAAYCLDLQ